MTGFNFQGNSQYEHRQETIDTTVPLLDMQFNVMPMTTTCNTVQAHSVFIAMI